LLSYDEQIENLDLQGLFLKRSVGRWADLDDPGRATFWSQKLSAHDL